MSPEESRQAEIIEKLTKENESPGQRLEKAEKENERLRKLLEEALRSLKRQAAPFSKGKPKSDPKRPGRKSGGDYGARARSVRFRIASMNRLRFRCQRRAPTAAGGCCLTNPRPRLHTKIHRGMAVGG